ncbi:TerD family protein [Streptomyces sp. ISL-111]|uniref:TerD family protein n=1 Tax=Streptomyces sp. ISL-111 TaxID=2819175 RepID=UPI001BE5DA8D|nr:TerD family protein [Streptomyces sp. ISL-111]MBT2381132.1 TerD family protein [Streptomyces sp. ISL-111]
MSALHTGLTKVEVSIAWDPSALGGIAHDLDIVAAAFTDPAPSPGGPEYLVRFGSRSPDGTITLDRHSETGQGFGFDEIMTLELDRLAPRYARVVVGVAIQQSSGALTFGDIPHARVRIRQSHNDLLVHTFASIPAARAATVAEFIHDGAGTWELREIYQGFDIDPATLGDVMGTVDASD